MDSIFIIVASAMLLIVVLMRFHVKIGPAILCGGLFIWIFRGAVPLQLWEALQGTMTQSRTWELIFCLYFVMCLEIELRKSDSLKGVVQSLKAIFLSNKVTLAVMPAFLGLLPSMGGARFSCPIVKEASDGIVINDVQKSAINLWFRHIFEFSNPLVPGLIFSCGIAGVPIGSLIAQVGWLTILCFVLGWIFLIRPLKTSVPAESADPVADRKIDYLSLFLALGPILLVFLLVVAFHLKASIATGLAVFGFWPLFKVFKRPVALKDIIFESLDWRLFFTVFCIIYFIELLTSTGTLDALTQGFIELDFSKPILFAVLGFIFGALTGMSQAYIAMVIPLVVAMSPHDVVLMGIVTAFGMAGQMVTPTHVCILLTVDYFKSDMWKTIGINALLAILMLTIFSGWTYLRYYAG